MACLPSLLWGQQPSLRSTEQRVALTIVSDLAAEGNSEANTALQNEASALATEHTFVTFYQGQYLHFASQSEDVRNGLARQMFDRKGAYDASPCLRIHAWMVNKDQQALRLEVTWAGYTLQNLSAERKATIEALAEQAGNEYLAENTGQLKAAASILVAEFRRLLKVKINACFYIAGGFYDEKDTLFVPYNDSIGPRILMLPVAKAIAIPADTSRAIKNFKWEKGSQKVTYKQTTEYLKVDKASSSLEGTVIRASALVPKRDPQDTTKIKYDTLMASTRVVVVEVDFVQKLNESLVHAYDPNDDKKLSHYGTIRNGKIGKEIYARYKFHPLDALINEPLIVSVKPDGVPGRILRASAGNFITNLGSTGNSKEFELNPILRGATNRFNSLKLMVQMQLARNVYLHRDSLIRIPVRFIQLTLRIPQTNNTFSYETSNMAPNEFLNETNAILHQIGVEIYEGALMALDTIIDADGKLEYDLNTNNFLELSTVVRQSNAIAACRRGNQMPIVFTPKIERLGGVPQSNDENTVRIVPGVSITRRFVVFLNGEAKKQGRTIGSSFFPHNTLAHEIGHAYFGWLHPFSQFNVAVGKDKFNLMDYQSPSTQRYVRAYLFPTVTRRRIVVPLQ